MGFHVTFAAFAFLSILSSASSAACTSTRYRLSLLSGSTKIITSPNYPLNYPSPSTPCGWKITAPYGYKVKITFTSFDTYGSGLCSAFANDYLDVYDSSFEWRRDRLGRYCGGSLPPNLVSSGRYMHLNFSTYSHSPRKGFRIEVTAVDKIYCEPSLLLTADSSTTKILTSPNYPSNYPTSSSCEWRIRAPSGYVVQLNFTSFKTYGSIYSAGSCSSSSHYHNLDIYDSSTAISSKLLGKYCGNFVPANVVSRGRYMFLKFSSTSILSKSGFRIEYKAVKDPPACSSTTYLSLASGSTRIITSPNYPLNYSSPSTPCSWGITAPDGYKVKIKFTSFDTYGSGSCAFLKDDALEIYNYVVEWRGYRLGRYCGSSLPPNLVSSGSDMYLKFSTYSHSPRKGFRIEVTAVDKIYCEPSLLLTADSSTTKILTSPNYPSNYPTSSSCEWRITAPSGNVVQLNFTSFNTYGSMSWDESCSSSPYYHNLDIYDSSTAISSKLLGKYCGNFVPANVVSRGRYMFLKFNSTSIYSKSGFRIEYKAVKDQPEDHSICSPFNSASTNDNINIKASSSYKYIKSPYYPNKYPSNIQCTWTISASSSSKRIKLILTDVNIHNYYGYSCSSTSDILTIRDGSSSYSSLLKQLCGKRSYSAAVTSSGEKMWIRFKTNSDNYFTGSTAGLQAKFIEYEVKVDDSSSKSSKGNAGMIVGIIFGVVIFVGLIVCCIWVSKRQGNAGYVQANGAATSVQTTTTTHAPPVSAPQYPLQQVGPVYQGRYPPPQPAGSYPTAPPGGSYPLAMGNKPQQPQGNYPPSVGGYPLSSSNYPQQQGFYPPSASGPPPPYPVDDIPDIPPPQYPGLPTYPPQSNDPHNVQFQGPQTNAPYPPPQGSENPVSFPDPLSVASQLPQ